MVGLAYSDLKEKILKEKMIEGYEDIEKQLTPNGFDVRACTIIEVKEAGEVGISKEENKSPILGKAYVLEGHEKILENLNIEKIITMKYGEKLPLYRLKPYLLITCEKINTPEDLYFKIEIRSTLFRYGQMILETAFGDAGYKGRLTFLLLPTLDTKLALGCRVAQISFVTLTSRAHYENQKECGYQGGKIL